jgi:hypothetical protein
MAMRRWGRWYGEPRRTMSSWLGRSSLSLTFSLRASPIRRRADSWVERQYAHGVTCALGWVLGEIDDPALMAPLHNGAGAVIPFVEREEYRIRLRACALPDSARVGDLTSWPPVARAH